MKILLAAALAFAFAVAGSGCVVVAPRKVVRPAASASRCPPGHQWSDGRCHATGRGNEKRER